MERIYGKSLDIYYTGSEKCEKSHSFGPAVRPHYLLHFVIKGKGIYYVGDKKIAIKTGEGFLIKPGELTTYIADSEEPWEYMWVAFDGYEAREILGNCQINYTMTAKNYESFVRDFTELLEISSCAQYNQYSAMAIFYKMISQLVSEEKIIHGSYDKIYFEKASDYIHNNYMYKISVEDIANYVGIDRTYLYKVFVANSNQSPKSFLNNIKINSAKNMLIKNEFTLTQIALSCGFADAPVLCKHFKKITGKTPKEFKEEVKRGREMQNL